jgi:hypothetical protein
MMTMTTCVRPQCLGKGAEFQLFISFTQHSIDPYKVSLDIEHVMQERS